MKIKNIQNYDWYIDYYEDTNIVVSSTSNQYGVINKDENDNYLNSYISAGKNYMELTAKNIPTSIIIYDNTGYIYIDKNINEEHKFLIKPSNTIKYYTHSNKTIINETTNNKININLVGKTVFKVIVNGITLTSFTTDSTGITVTGNDVNYLTGNDYIIVYTYEGQSTFSGTLTFKYKSPHHLVPAFNDLETEIDTYRKIENFSSVDISTEGVENEINETFRLKKDKEYVDKNNTISINMYEDIRKELKGEIFRIIAYDKTDNEYRFYSNCSYNISSSKKYDRIFIETTYTFTFDDEITIMYEGESLYGTGLYGEGTYDGIEVEVL